MKLTVQLQLLPTSEQATSLLATMKAMNAAATHAARVGFNNNVFGQVSIHHLCYYEIRERFNLSAQMAVRAIGKTVECFARDKKICPEFRPDGAVPLDNRLYRIVNMQSVSISTVHGRIKVPFLVGEYFAGSLSRKMGEADLVYKDGKFYLYISVEFEEEPPIEPAEWIGIDLGIVNLATDSTGETFSGEQVDRNRKRRATARKQYQRKGTKSAKRRLKKMAGRQRRFQTWANHNISKRLVEKAKARSAGIVFEDLKGIRSRLEDTVSRKFRRRLGNWAFSQLRLFVEYKTRLAGVPFVTVDPRNSSRTCSKCGHCEKGNRPNQATFKCKQCFFSTNADYNAALNIKAWGACKPPLKVATAQVSDKAVRL